MKTSYRKTVIKSLQGLNDQLCYFLFSSHQFSVGLNDFSIGAKQLFTTDLYTQNPYAPSIHVKISKLSNFIDQITESTFQTYVSSTYEVVAQYLDDASSLLANFNGPLFQQVCGRGLGPEEKLQKELVRAHYSAIKNADIATLTYYRLRRNHIIHRSSVISPHFRDFISNNSNMLNQYWKGAVKKQDFGTHDLATFSASEAIDALKLLRIVFERVDEHVARLLDINSVVDSIAKDEFSDKPQKINSDIVQKRISILMKKVKIIYGLTPSQSVLETAAKKHGAK